MVKKVAQENKNTFLCNIKLNDMNKFYLLRDEATGKYFTDTWGKYWSAEIEEAYRFSSNSNMDSEIDKLYEDNSDPFGGVTNIELVTLYSKP